MITCLLHILPLEVTHAVLVFHTSIRLVIWLTKLIVCEKTTSAGFRADFWKEGIRMSGNRVQIYDSRAQSPTEETNVMVPFWASDLEVTGRATSRDFECN